MEKLTRTNYIGNKLYMSRQTISGPCEIWNPTCNPSVSAVSCLATSTFKTDWSDRIKFTRSFSTIRPNASCINQRLHSLTYSLTHSLNALTDRVVEGSALSSKPRLFPHKLILSDHMWYRVDWRNPRWFECESDDYIICFILVAVDIYIVIKTRTCGISHFEDVVRNPPVFCSVVIF